jgi:hypothetical protein
MKTIFSKRVVIFLFLLLVFIVLAWFIQNKRYFENMENIKGKVNVTDDDDIGEEIAIKRKEKKLREAYIDTLTKHEKERHFPYRYLYDENGKILPIVLVSGFFRDDKERNMFNEYIYNGIKVVGITAYKSFPKPATDKTGDSTSVDDPFDYYANITNWLSCFRDPHLYGFDKRHNLIDISESDFYNADESTEIVEKKYDFIYVCFKDSDDCPMDGWNAVNRNYKLALDCLPIIINEFKQKVLIVGRVNCGLEKLYGDDIEIVDFMPYFEFQEKLRQSRFLFVPNIYDASPRVVAEALVKDIPVLMNRSIVCGSKYINNETGELFTDENDIRFSLKKLLDRKDVISPKNWWKKNYSKNKMGKKLRDYLYEQYPDILENTKEVNFYL